MSIIMFAMATNTTTSAPRSAFSPTPSKSAWQVFYFEALILKTFLWRTTDLLRLLKKLIFPLQLKVRDETNNLHTIPDQTQALKVGFVIFNWSDGPSFICAICHWLTHTLWQKNVNLYARILKWTTLVLGLIVIWFKWVLNLLHPLWVLKNPEVCPVDFITFC